MSMTYPLPLPVGTGQAVGSFAPAHRWFSSTPRSSASLSAWSPVQCAEDTQHPDPGGAGMMSRGTGHEGVLGQGWGDLRGNLRSRIGVAGECVVCGMGVIRWGMPLRPRRKVLGAQYLLQLHEGELHVCSFGDLLLIPGQVAG